MTKTKKFFGGLYKVCKVLLIVILLFILGIVVIQRFTNNKVNFMGFGIYTIISESMLPKYEVGDMILAIKVEKQDLKVGDDVVYRGEVSDFKDKTITHRVVRIDSRIHTKGLTNTIEDPAIEMSQIYGKVVCKLGIFSLFSKLMNNQILFYVLIFVPFTLLVFFEIRDVVEENTED